MKKLIDKIKSSERIMLSTHRTPDGDGLGSELAMYHALIKLNKKVRLVHVDTPAFKYQFLTKKVNIEVFKQETKLEADLFLTFDTNDARMLPGLWEKITETGTSFAFIDHHPILEEAPALGDLSYVDIYAASTGEIVFELISRLKIELDQNIAEAIYTSICFDTQLFRYIKSSANSHKVAAALIPHLPDPEEIHNQLFGNIPLDKFKFVSYCATKIDFKFNGHCAVLDVAEEDLILFNMSTEDTRDLPDQIFGIESVEVVILISPSQEGKKISLRSKKPIKVLKLAKSLGGGGHKFASGAFVKKSDPRFNNLKEYLIEEAGKLL